MAGKKVRSKRTAIKSIYYDSALHLIFTIFILIPIGMVLYYSLTDFNMYQIPEFFRIEKLYEAVS